MPQYYTLEQSKNVFQHLGRTERSKHWFLFSVFQIGFLKKGIFKLERTQITFKWFSSSCFRLSRTPYAMDAMHR